MSRILLGVTGSVAAVKTPELLRALRGVGHEVKVAATGPALSFFDPAEWGEAGDGLLPVRGQSTLYLDADEWPQDRLFQVGEPVLHIELRKWAEALLIAPLDANTLAKMALGLCDNLLTCVYRAWDFSRPVILAPAMNTLMWEHPATAAHLKTLIGWHGGVVPMAGSAPDLCEAANQGCPRLHLVEPVSKRLACGDLGVGGLAAVDAIVAETTAFLAGQRPH